MASIRASHILVPTAQEASDILTEVFNGVDFEALAMTKSKCPSGTNGGDLGPFGRGQMVAPFESAVFALEIGEITKKPVQTQFGYHIIKRTG